MQAMPLRRNACATAAAGFAATVALGLAAATPAAAFTFHCRGNACRAVAFLDEGNGCTVVTNHSRFPVHVTQGIDQLSYDLAPGATEAPLIQTQCYGYYDGGETANFVGPATR